MVEMEVEAVKKEVFWVEASTLLIGYSTEDVEKHMAEMVDWQVGEDIEVDNANKAVWTMMDEWKSTKLERVQSGWDGNKNKIHLACPTVMAEVLEVAFDW